MLESLKSAALEWNARTSDRQKLQHVYVILLVVDVFLAGLVSLFNRSGSHELLVVAYALLIAVAVNFLAWALLKTAILDKLPRQTTSRGRTTSRRR